MVYKVTITVALVLLCGSAFAFAPRAGGSLGGAISNYLTNDSSTIITDDSGVRLTP